MDRLSAVTQAGRDCPDCGAASTVGAAVCRECGANLELGEFTQGLQARRASRRVERTAHFAIHTPVGSFADQQAASVGAALERLLDAVCGLLELDPGPLGRIRVYLADFLADPYQPDQVANSGSWIAQGRGDIYSIYRPDAPGLDLEKVLVQLVVWRSTGVGLARTPLAWEAVLGLCRHAADPGVMAATHQALYQLVEGQMPTLAPLWATGSTSAAPSQREWLGALSFLSYLRERNGGAALRALLQAIANHEPDDAARAAGRRSLRAVEQDWWKAVRAARPGQASGIGRFLRQSLHYLRPYWRKQLAILLLLCVQLAFQQILPYSQRLIVDEAIGRGDLPFLALLIGVLIALVALTLVASVLNDMLIARVSESVMLSLRQQMFGKLQFLTHRFYARLGTADILSRFLSDLRSVEQGLTGTLTSGTFMLLTLVVSLIHILAINWVLGILVTGTLPLFYLATRLLGPPATRASLRFAEEQAGVTTVLQENLQAHPVVKAFTLQPTAMSTFNQAAERLYQAAVRYFFLSSLYGVGATLLTSLVQIAVLGLGGYFAIRGQLAVGNLFEFLSLLGLVIGPVQGISGLLQNIQIATAAMDRVEDVLEAEPEVRDQPHAATMAPLHKSIRFEDVTFSYRGDAPQLDGVNLEIPAGQSVAFVGPSGSGKSTIINMVLRFYNPDHGRVLLDDQDVSCVSVESLRQQIGIVFQENFLFNTSVRENIRYGREDATDAEIEDAARLAEIHEVIMALPEGYDTVVGERGGALSGGQRQRLAIARAIVRRPSILVLDEATSALDARTENAINHTLAALGRGRTTIAVTHRLGAAMTADRIFVLDRGHLVEQGTHQELIELNGLYRKLYEEQAGPVSNVHLMQVEHLRQVPLLARLDEQLLQRIAAVSRIQRVVAGTDLVNPNTTINQLYVVLDGELDVLGPGLDVRRPVLAVLKPGAYLGDAALLRDLPVSATVRARTDAELLTVSQQALAGLMQATPDLRRQLESTLEAAEAAGAGLPPNQPRPGAVLERRDRAGNGQRIPLLEAETGIGRNRGNDVVVDDRYASGFHARIQRSADGRLLLIDSHSTNGTFLNGTRLDAPAALNEGDVIQIGSATFVFHTDRVTGTNEATGAPANLGQPVEGAAWLRISAGPETGRTVLVQGDELTLGRTSNNHLVVADRAVSAQHARLVWTAEGYAVVDSGSTNGTLVNGQRIAGPWRLCPGDTIQVGSTQLTFELRPAGAPVDGGWRA